ncbi:MAG: thiamine phosphate synthase [Chloroflexota bacterium]
MSGHFDSTLRLIDANLDRLSEGLRVLEDVARFILQDTPITDQLRDMRHRLSTAQPHLSEKLLAARDAGEDIGREAKGVEETKENIVDVIASNAKRGQESLRVLEEFAKLSSSPAYLNESSLQEARFTLYDIEKKLTLKLAREDKKNRITGVYVILDTETLGERNEIEVAQEVIKGGASIIQLRDKHKDKESLATLIHELKQICNESGVLFLLNDYVDMALATDVDGVHLGPNDFPIPLARRILPLNKLIGRSVRSVEQARQAEEEGADYLGVGSMYASPTRPDAEIIGPKKLRQIKATSDLPVVGIGGINESNADHVIDAGADSIAVIDAVLHADDIFKTSRQLSAKFEGKNPIGVSRTSEEEK